MYFYCNLTQFSLHSHCSDVRKQDKCLKHTELTMQITRFVHCLAVAKHSFGDCHPYC